MISKTQQKHQRRERRHNRIRGRISGTAERPRFAVYRSNSHIYAQLIDDETGTTLVASSDLQLKTKGPLSEKAKAIGEDIAKKATDKKINKVVFDRGGFDYAGRIQALADAAREGGLTF